MQGKILAEGLISGEDGHRYTFTASDLKNAQGKSGDVLVGCEVDFEGKDDKAIEIYITKQAFNADDLKQKLFSSDLEGIKLKAYAMIACSLLSFIPFVGFLFTIAAFVLAILITIALQKTSQSTTLLKNFILMIVVAIIGFLIFMFAGFVGFGVTYFAMFAPAAGGIPESVNEGLINALGVSVIGIITFLLICIACCIFLYRYYKELAYITNEPFFMYSFWCVIIGTLTMFIFIGFFIEIVGLVLYVLAWVRTKEIRKSYSAIV